MLRKISIRKFSFYIAAGIALINVIILFAAGLLWNFDLMPIALVMMFSLSFIFTYIVIKYLVIDYIYKRIRLIYKVINRDAEDDDELVDLDQVKTSLEDVNSQVLKWALKKEQQISTLTSLENYRKKYVGDISHELKTPIFSIQGYLHTLLDGGIHDDNINTRYLQRAVSNVDRLQKIVEDLEMINKLESQEQDLDLSTFDVRNLVAEIMQDLESQAREKNIRMGFKSGSDQEFLVLADRNSIQQVLINLIQNSIKYGRENGETKIGFYDLTDVLLVEVEDDGLGINEEDLPHVFDRFYRADKSRAREEGGTGLGLSIVKHIMEAHNQKINVRSTAGKGSVFGFTLKKKSKRK